MVQVTQHASRFYTVQNPGHGLGEKTATWISFWKAANPQIFSNFKTGPLTLVTLVHPSLGCALWGTHVSIMLCLELLE